MAEFYRRRWGIGNSKSYDKLYEQMMPRIAGTDLSIHILLWLLPFALYNIRISARFITTRQGVDCSAGPLATLKLFVSMLLDGAITQYAICRAPD